MGFFDYFTNYYIHHQFGYTYIITELVCCFCISFLFNKIDFKNPKYYLRLLIDYACVFVVYIFISCFINLILAALSSSASAFSMYIVWPLTSLLHTIYPKKPTRYLWRLTNALAVSMFIILAVSLSGAIGSYITTITGGPNSTLTDYTLYIVLFALLAIIFAFKIVSPFNFKYIKSNLIILLDAIYLISYILSLIYSIIKQTGSIQSTMGEIFFRSTLIAADFVIYFIYYITIKYYNSIIDYQISALKNESEKSQFEINSVRIEELHRIKHDIKNQFNLIQTMLNNNEYDEMKKYFADINENVRVAIDFSNCGNYIIDKVIDLEQSKAKTNGYSINTKISVPKEINIDSNDLTSLLTNLLDNAIEAQNRDNLKDNIELKIIYESSYLIINVTNHTHCAIKEGNDPVLKSTKSDRLNHGYGVKIIKSICNKYHGAYKFSVNDNVFTFDGMLLIESEQENAKKSSNSR